MMETPTPLTASLKRLEPFAVALSGGTDSSILLAAAAGAGVRAVAVTIDTGLNPGGEIEAAEALAERLGLPHQTIACQMLHLPEVRLNRHDRCYACKRLMMETVMEAAEMMGCRRVADGTHADDRPEDRPGMAALRDLGIASPFADCGMGKAEIEALAPDLGVQVRPQSACLATRFPQGEHLTSEKIGQVRQAEMVARRYITGWLRVRCLGGRAVIECRETGIPHQRDEVRALDEEMVRALEALGFESVILNHAGSSQGEGATHTPVQSTPLLVTGVRTPFLRNGVENRCENNFLDLKKV